MFGAQVNGLCPSTRAPEVAKRFCYSLDNGSLTDGRVTYSWHASNDGGGMVKSLQGWVHRGQRHVVGRPWIVRHMAVARSMWYVGRPGGFLVSRSFTYLATASPRDTVVSKTDFSLRFSQGAPDVQQCYVVRGSSCRAPHNADFQYRLGNSIPRHSRHGTEYTHFTVHTYR